MTSPRTSSNQRRPFSGRWTNSKNSPAVMSAALRAVVVAVVMCAASGNRLFSLPAESSPGQGQRAVDHDRLAQRRRNNLGETGKRLEHPIRDPLPQRIEKQLLAD